MPTYPHCSSHRKLTPPAPAGCPCRLRDPLCSTPHPGLRKAQRACRPPVGQWVAYMLFCLPLSATAINACCHFCAPYSRLHLSSSGFEDITAKSSERNVDLKLSSVQKQPNSVQGYFVRHTPFFPSGAARLGSFQRQQLNTYVAA